MSEKSPYSDKRSDFFARFFEKAKPYDEYVETGSVGEQSKWRGFEELSQLKQEERERLESFTRTMNVLVVSGIWCGDCARQGPMLRAIENAAPLMDLRFIDNRENVALLEELKLNGAAKVPIVVTLSEDFFEIGRFGDAHLSVYRRKAATQLGPACDAGIFPPEPEEIARELSEWVDHFERQHLMLRLAPLLRRRYED